MISAQPNDRRVSQVDVPKSAAPHLVTYTRTVLAWFAVMAVIGVATLMVLVIAWGGSHLFAWDGGDACLQHYTGTDPVQWFDVVAIDRSYFPVRNECTYRGGFREDISEPWSQWLIIGWLTILGVLLIVGVRSYWRWLAGIYRGPAAR